MPFADTPAMNANLAEIAMAVAPGAPPATASQASRWS